MSGHDVRAAEAVSARIETLDPVGRAYILYWLATTDQGLRVLEQAFGSLDRYHERQHDQNGLEPTAEGRCYHASTTGSGNACWAGN